MLYRFLRGIGKVILFLLFRVEVIGKDIIPSSGPLIIAINHISPMDPPVLGILFPRMIHFFAADDLFRVPVVGWVIRHLGIIPVNRREKDFRSLKKAVELLRKGKVVAIFPQGGIPSPLSPNRYEIKPGVAYLAMKTGVPILSVCISGTDRAMPRGAKFFKRVFVKIRLEYRSLLYSTDKEKILQEVRKEIFACEDTYSGR